MPFLQGRVSLALFLHSRGATRFTEEGAAAMKRLWKLVFAETIGPLGFLMMWVGLCTFLLNKYAGYILVPLS